MSNLPASAALDERLIEAVIARLRNVRSASGYRSDAGARVFDSRINVEEANGGVLVVWETNESIGAAPATSDQYVFDAVLGFAVDAFYPCDREDTGKALRAIKADVKRCLMQDLRTWLAPVLKFGVLSYQGAQLFPRIEGSTVEGVTLNFTVTYREVYGDPSSQTSA